MIIKVNFTAIVGMRPAIPIRYASVPGNSNSAVGNCLTKKTLSEENTNSYFVPIFRFSRVIRMLFNSPSWFRTCTRKQDIPRVPEVTSPLSSSIRASASAISASILEENHLYPHNRYDPSDCCFASVRHPPATSLPPPRSQLGITSL